MRPSLRRPLRIHIFCVLLLCENEVTLNPEKDDGINGAITKFAFAGAGDCLVIKRQNAGEGDPVFAFTIRNITDITEAKWRWIYAPIAPQITPERSVATYISPEIAPVLVKCGFWCQPKISSSHRVVRRIELVTKGLQIADFNRPYPLKPLWTGADARFLRPALQPIQTGVAGRSAARLTIGARRTHTLSLVRRSFSLVALVAAVVTPATRRLALLATGGEEKAQQGHAHQVL